MPVCTLNLLTSRALTDNDDSTTCDLPFHPSPHRLDCQILHPRHCAIVMWPIVQCNHPLPRWENLDTMIPLMPGRGHFDRHHQ